MKSPWGEEIPVTFQVGFVGNDGVLLGSDKRVMMMGQVRSSSLAEKIHIEADDLAYCCTGGDLASLMREPIIAAIRTPTGDFRSDLLQNCQMTILETLKGVKLNELLSQKGAILFARRANSGVELWRILVGTLGTSVLPDQITDKVTQGDESSSARLFVERYFPKHPVAIASLVPLAAHSILTAGVLNPDAVEGLEIVLCTQSAFRKLPSDEIAALIESSTKRDLDIVRVLGLG
jgi:hypothetical protein